MIFSQKGNRKKMNQWPNLDVWSGGHCQYAYPHVSVVPVLGQKQFIHVVHGGGEVFGDKDISLEGASDKEEGDGGTGTNLDDREIYLTVTGDK